MKVKLTHNGKAFGRTMHKEVAITYINNTKFVIQGLSWEKVTHADANRI